MVWFLLHNNGRKSIHASLCMQSIMNANNFSSDHSDHIETYKHAVTHAHIITHLFFFLKSRAVPHCFSVAVLSFRRAEVLHTDSDTDFCPPGHPLRLQEGRAPRWQHFLRGTGWWGGFFCRPGGLAQGDSWFPQCRMCGWTPKCQHWLVAPPSYSAPSFSCISLPFQTCFFVPQRCSFSLFFTIPLSSLTSLWRTLFSSCLLTKRTVVVLCEKHWARFGCLNSHAGRGRMKCCER